MGRLFGTDGARGVANTELTCELAMNIGKAAAMVLAGHSGAGAAAKKPRVVIGKDTRISGDMLEAALVAGLCSVGADVELLGVLPTPAVAYLVKKYGADAGIMISASHNPCEFNGIKLFNGEGYKLPDALEEEIEAIVLDGAQPYAAPTGGGLGRVSTRKTAAADYIARLLSTTDVRLDGMRLLLDCANGSAAATAAKLFSALGADCTVIHDTPDGVNINEKCGSTHIELMAEAIKKGRYFAGIAFDGDADRCLAIDETGSFIDGDQIMIGLGLHMKQAGTLKGDTLVATVMSNLGFFRAAEEHGLATAATKVGDRYVLEEMLEKDYMIGGEQSGHVILREFATTGDGQLTAVQLLAACRENGWKLSRLAEMMPRFPQVLINVRADAAGKAAYTADKKLAAEIEKANAALGKTGRILIRPSGTEPVIRVMVEGKDFDGINKIAVELSEKIKEVIHDT
ncbi:MAG: phosphoglucosamine mutase [Oscillospiraceae bacterium]|nr:phosphoglucosamine mutase [Oscillospiraceae bacterium]